MGPALGEGVGCGPPFCCAFPKRNILHPILFDQWGYLLEMKWNSFEEREGTGVARRAAQAPTPRTLAVRVLRSVLSVPSWQSSTHMRVSVRLCPHAGARPRSSPAHCRHTGQLPERACPRPAREAPSDGARRSTAPSEEQRRRGHRTCRHPEPEKALPDGGAVVRVNIAAFALSHQKSKESTVKILVNLDCSWLLTDSRSIPCASCKITSN